MYTINLIFTFFILSFTCSEGLHFDSKERIAERDKPWPGKWFPHPPESTEDVATSTHRIPMGVHNSKCDDAKTHLEVDWYDDKINYTCYDFRSSYEPNINTRPVYEELGIPIMYSAAHACMNESIDYYETIPTFGTHRPLWAKWGEYLFLPRQRWVHNLEHGGLVMLYHPCANRLEVEKLRDLVTKCLYRHVITPYNLLSEERPLALVAWGRRLQMSVVAPKVVTDFVKEAALRGPEHISRNGQYDHGLVHPAKVVTSEDDEILCPGAGEWN